jgi:hypothetical protein
MFATKDTHLKRTCFNTSCMIIVESTARIDASSYTSRSALVCVVNEASDDAILDARPVAVRMRVIMLAHNCARKHAHLQT